MPNHQPAEELAQKKCRPCEGGVTPWPESKIQEYLQGLPGWRYLNGRIEKTFSFQNYYQTTAFVNAVTWIAHTEDHHPDIEFGYKACTVRYSTHSIQGISENDLICAAKVDLLLKNQ